MARKRGQIVTRGDRRWLVRVYLGRDSNTGRRKYHNRTIRGALREAQQYLNKRLRERDEERDCEGSAISCTEYFDRWLQMAAKPKLREKSFRDYEGLLARYIRPKLGDCRLLRIAPLDLQSIYQDMREQGLSPRTIGYTHAVVHAALEQAVKWRLLSQNPAGGVELPKSARSEMRVMNAEEVRRFLEYALLTPYGLVFAIAVTTGARPSEYLALRWQDVDFAREMVTVTRTLVKDSIRWRFADTKRARSRRIIQLQRWVVSLLRKLRQGASEPNPLDPIADAQIFKTQSGRPINSDSLARQFKRILRKAGLPEMRLYNLRHTAATLALTAGVSPKVLAEQLGHASCALTLDIYAQSMPHLQGEAAERVEALIYPECGKGIRVHHAAEVSSSSDREI